MEGFDIKAVAGTSAGGMVAAIYAAGWGPEEIIEEFSKINQDTLYSFGRGPALLGIKGITQAMENFIQEETFADLKMPCALTAVDLNDMREVTLKDGRVLDAVMATIAIPGVFPPRKWGDTHLVDGGVLDPVPVEIVRSLAPDLPVVAVSLSPRPEKWKDLAHMEKIIETPLLKPIANLRVAQAFDIFVRSIEVMTHMLSDSRLKLEEPAVVIRPDVAHIGILDKVNIKETASLGDQAVLEVREELEKLKKSSRKSWKLFG
jgi:NTE family protein